jgi:hypothetical protein
VGECGTYWTETGEAVRSLASMLATKRANSGSKVMAGSCEWYEGAGSDGLAGAVVGSGDGVWCRESNTSDI